MGLRGLGLFHQHLEPIGEVHIDAEPRLFEGLAKRAARLFYASGLSGLSGFRVRLTSRFPSAQRSWGLVSRLGGLVFFVGAQGIPCHVTTCCTIELSQSVELAGTLPKFKFWVVHGRALAEVLLAGSYQPLRTQVWRLGMVQRCVSTV